MCTREGKRSHGKLRHRWEDNIKIDFWEMVGGRGLDSSGSGCRSVADFCEHSNEPLGSIKRRGI
jgi:hypothetical protein